VLLRGLIEKVYGVEKWHSNDDNGYYFSSVEIGRGVAANEFIDSDYYSMISGQTTRVPSISFFCLIPSNWILYIAAGIHMIL
jgi:hypothetical protein